MLTDSQIDAIFDDSPFIARRAFDKSCYEVLENTRPDWQTTIGTDADFVHHGNFNTFSDAEIHRRRLHVRRLLNEYLAPICPKP